MWGPYVRFINKAPGCATAGIALLYVTMAACGFLLRDEYPDFSDAGRGFDPRGTTLAGKDISLNRHLQLASCERELTKSPSTWTDVSIRGDEYKNELRMERSDITDSTGSRYYCREDGWVPDYSLGETSGEDDEEYEGMGARRARRLEEQDEEHDRSVETKALMETMNTMTKSMVKTLRSTVMGLMTSTWVGRYYDPESASSPPPPRARRLSNAKPWVETSIDNSLHKVSIQDMNERYNIDEAIEIVFKLENGLTAEALKRVCEVDKIVHTTDLGDGTVFDAMSPVPSLSVGAVFAHFQNKVCSELTDADVAAGIAILETCAVPYHERGDDDNECMPLIKENYMLEDCPPGACGDREYIDKFDAAYFDYEIGQWDEGSYANLNCDGLHYMQNDLNYDGRYALSKGAAPICGVGVDNSGAVDYGDVANANKGCDCTRCACSTAGTVTPTIPTKVAGCSNPLPDECVERQGNLVWLTLNGLVNKQYLNPAFDIAQNGAALTRLRIHVTRDAIREESAGAKLREEVLGPLLDMKVGGATLVAFHMNDKFDRFSASLLNDSLFATIAFILIFMMMSRHAGSMFIAGMAFFQMIMAFLVSYFVYQIVFWMPFFPFLNLTGIFIVIGIGADDVFVFIEAWHRTGRELPVGSTREQRMIETLSAAGSSMLVTSLTTSAAFFANIVSPICAIKCFGLYCGMVVSIDFIMVMIFLPAVVLFYDKSIAACKCCGKACSGACAQRTHDETLAAAQKGTLRESAFQMVFTKLSKLSDSPVKAMILVVLALCLVLPLGLKATELDYPKTDKFQLFKDGDPYERYCCSEKYQDEFASETEDGGDLWAVRIAVGIKPIDNGNKLDPRDWGKAQYVEISDEIYSTESQQWFYNLAKSAESEDWFDDTKVSPFDGGTSNPFFVAYDLMQETCNSGSVPGGNRAVCCGKLASDYPLAPAAMQECVEYMAKNPDIFWFYWDSLGIWFEYDKANPTQNTKPKVMVFRIPTTVPRSGLYTPANDFRIMMEAWFDKQLESAPAFLKVEHAVWIRPTDGWLTLQSANGEGAVSSMIYATIMAIIILAVMTKFNIVITVVAGGVIAATVGVVVGLLVYDGWSLGIIQSVIFSCAIGMAVDFVAHLSHMYNHYLEKGENPFEAAAMSTKIMAPSISMAAISTVTAGAVMSLGCSSLFLYSYGFFLMLLQVFAWILAFTLLVPMLGLVGCFAKRGSPALLCKTFKKGEGEGEGEGGNDAKMPMKKKANQVGDSMGANEKQATG